MTQLTQAAQTVEVQGIQDKECRTSQPLQPEICLSFNPTYIDNEYAYTPPKFVWGQEVAILGEWADVKESKLTEELNFYRIKAIKLIEPTIKVNGKKRLKSAPIWEYGIRDRHSTQELMWFLEDELVHKRQVLEKVSEF